MYSTTRERLKMSSTIKYLTGITNPAYNNRFVRTLGGVDAAGRVGVVIFGTNGIPVRVLAEKLVSKKRAPAFDATVLEDDHFSSDFYLPSVASDNEPPNEEDDAGTPERYITAQRVKTLPLGEVFLFNHERIFDAIYSLGSDRKMHILVQKRILAGYFDGNDNGNSELVSGSPFSVFTAAGGLAEQFVYKALRLLYMVGPRQHTSGDGWFVTYYFDHEERTTNIQIRMTFDGKPASLARHAPPPSHRAAARLVTPPPLLVTLPSHLCCPMWWYLLPGMLHLPPRRVPHPV